MARILTYTLTAFALSGCWVNDLFIRNLDTIIEFKTSDLLGLYYPQKEQLDKDVSAFLTEQKELAPLIEAKLGLYEQELKKGAPSKEQILKEIAFWQKLHQKIATDLIKKHMQYLSGLTEKQQKAFFESEAEKNKELEEKIEKADIEELSKGYLNLFGELSNKQKAILKENKKFLIQRQRTHLKRRKDYQKNFKEFFAQKKSNKAFQEFALKRLNQRYDPKTNQKHAEIAALMLQAMDSNGKEALLENIKKYQGWIKTFKNTDY